MAKARAAKVKRVPGVSAEEQAKLDTVLAALEKQHGEGILATLTKPPSMTRFEKQVPTGSIGLDIAIGPMKRVGGGRWQAGYPKGIVIETIGPEASGKTTLMLLSIANCQLLGGRCAFLDMEHTLDPFYAHQLGVNMRDLWCSQPGSGDQCLQVAATLVRSQLYDMVVIDSVAALVPQSELDGEVGDSSMGAQARLMSQFFRMIVPFIGTHNRTTLMLTNQIRYKIGRVFGNPETTPGGNALKYYANIRLDVRKAAAIKLGGGTIEDDSDPQIIGQRMRVKVIKNKIAPPFRVAEFSLHYGKGIDTVEELADLCVMHGLIEKNGAWYKLPGSAGQHQGKCSADGLSGLVPALRTDQALCYTLYDQLMSKNMLSLGCTPEGKPIDGVFKDGMPTMHAQFEPPTEEEVAMTAGQDLAPVPLMGVTT